jgi:hypothetical protein
MSQTISGQTNCLQISFSGEKVSADFNDFVIVSHKDFQVDGLLEQLWFE